MRLDFTRISYLFIWFSKKRMQQLRGDLLNRYSSIFRFVNPFSSNNDVTALCIIFFTARNEWILQQVTNEYCNEWREKRVNFAISNAQKNKFCKRMLQWVSFSKNNRDNYWKVLPSEIKIKIDKIIVCSEIPFSKNSYQIETSQLICKES